MEQEIFAPKDAPPTCAECRSELKNEARRCAQCGAHVNPVRRWIVSFGSLFGAILLAVPLFEIASGAGGHFARWLDDTAEFAIAGAFCTPETYTFSLHNTETHDTLRVSSIDMIKLNGAPIQDRLVFGTQASKSDFGAIIPPGQTIAQVASRGSFVASMPPISCSLCNFTFELNVETLSGEDLGSQYVECQSAELR